MRHNGVVSGSCSGRMRSWHGSRGFRLNLRRFSVSRLRTRFMCLLRLLSKWRWSSLLLLLKGNRSTTTTTITTSNNSISKSRLVASSEHPQFQDENNYYCNGHGHGHRRPTSLGRSNSFYAEAIADCLEFIKRSSISVDHHP
ncbi:hypothetical protein PanWU01x14_226810 [Parasponia andersonii]|uniref:Uncharacterized protein n=1 Tax=Parasponia andersonii TaxID=3476 RepID=A0A2P5BMR7_PARAD|nr:hypothetical protein PanWU01x14_226810 [Parasponia andersonii]